MLYMDHPHVFRWKKPTSLIKVLVLFLHDGRECACRDKISMFPIATCDVYNLKQLVMLEEQDLRF